MAGFDFGAPRIRRLGRQYDQVKVDPRVNNGTTAGGLAYALQSALKGYEQGQERRAIEEDEGHQEAAQSALVRGLKGEPAMDAPLPEGISGPVRPEIPGGIDYAAEELAGLEGNPYAGRLATQLLMSQKEQEAEARREAELYQRNRTDKLSDFQMQQEANRDNFLFERDNAYRAPTQRRIVQGADGRNYYEDTKEPVLPGVEPTNEPDFDVESKLRGEFTKATKDFVQVRDAYGRIRASAKDPSAAGDLALIFNYMKVLDPGSTVREGEFATAQNSAGIPGRLRAQYNSVVNGERLAPEQRGDFVNRAGSLYGQQEDFYKQVEGRYSTLAEQYNAAPERVVYDMTAGFVPDTPTPPPPTPSSADDDLIKKYLSQ